MQTLTFRRIGIFFLPLALSWMLMSAETPMSVSILARGANAEVLTAGFLLVMALSIWIESPVIDLLATGTTFAKDAQSVGVIRRFALILMGLVTVVHATVALTPLYDLLVAKVMRIPDPVREAAHLPFIILIPWSALIGWRRWRQGAMIRAGMTRAVSIGTTLRLLTIGGFGWGLLLGTKMNPLLAVAIAIVLSVACECAFIHWAAKPALKKIVEQEASPEPLGVKELWRFHLPLTGSTMLMMLSTPLVAAALARVDQSVLQMAAWQVALAMISLIRASTFGLSEVIIALGQSAQAFRQLRKFCLVLGLSLTGLMLLMAALRIDAWIFTTVLEAKPEWLPIARMAFIACALTPLFSAGLNYAKGRVTQAKMTLSRLWGIAAGISALVLGLMIGLHFRWPGVLTAAFAICLSQIAEVALYAWIWRRRKLTMAQAA